MDLLLVIDLQNGFINEFTKSSIIDIKELIDSNRFDKVVFTRFINDENNQNEIPHVEWHRVNTRGCPRGELICEISQ